MQCLYAENENNPFFDTNASHLATYKTEGTFIATYVMQFTRGIGEAELNKEFEEGNVDNLEYMTVSFPMRVKKVDDDLQFTVDQNAKLYFAAKEHGKGGLAATTPNLFENLFLHPAGTNVTDSPTVNLMRYFDKYMVQAQNGTNVYQIGAMMKRMLVDNLQHPWPIKIYGTLQEVTEGDAMAANPANLKFDDAFVRNPSKIDATLFALDNDANPFADAFKGAANRKVPAQKINIVYPGGDYNKL